MEPVIFIAFIGLQACFANGPHWFKHVQGCLWVQKLSERHYLVWLFHPAVLHGVRDYVVHFVIYSGKIIGAH
jgi:hypothetical protein